MVNKVTLIGNLGRDVEVRRLENGTAVAKFSVATNESYKDNKTGEWKKQTEWHDVICWRHLAERAEKQLAKGKLVYIEGKLTHRKYQDKEGIDRYKTEVVVGTFRLLEKRTDDSFTNSNSFPSNKEQSTATSSTNEELETKKDDGDLPF